MADAGKILQAAGSILLVDWPSREVPDTLTRAGYAVFVKGGPEPGHYSAYELIDGEVTGRPLGHFPDHADVVYSHRPVRELPGIVDLARWVGATVVWHQSGLAADGTKDPHGCWMPEDDSAQARAIVEAAGLTYLEAPYIAGARAGRLGIPVRRAAHTSSTGHRWAHWAVARS